MMTWRHVTPEDFALLARWLAAPHVARWWHHETSVAAVERDFGPSARREEPNEDLLAFLDGVPLGLLQRSFLHDYPEYLNELTPITAVPARAMTIDYLIGDAADVGRGLGTRLIRSALDRLWAEHRDAECVIVAVHADNIGSWRALEKAGLTRVAHGELDPDNPIDDRRHHIYRVDRPPRSVRFVPLPPAVLAALLAGDLATARAATGVPLSEWFLSDEVTWLWRMRLDQIATDPRSADWIVRAAVSVPDETVVGAGGFHGPPDSAGMVEIGYSTDPAYRRRGYARAMVTELLRWAAADPSVSTVRASISPQNAASLASIAGFGFTHVGEQWDDKDGTELLYERPARLT